MKKMLLGFFATVLLSVSANAQIKTKEDARDATSKVMVKFKNNLKPAFTRAKDFKDFKIILYGDWLNNLPEQGEIVLQEAYSFMSNKTSGDKILKIYDGKGIVNALKFQYDILLENPRTRTNPIVW